MFTGSAWADVLVVGGGHAGCEAALAAARLGKHVRRSLAPRRRWHRIAFGIGLADQFQHRLAFVALSRRAF